MFYSIKSSEGLECSGSPLSVVEVLKRLLTFLLDFSVLVGRQKLDSRNLARRCSESRNLRPGPDYTSKQTDNSSFSNQNVMKERRAAAAE